METFKPFPNALLNPKVDPIFKTLFTDNSDEARGALQSFLSALLGGEVSEIELQPNEFSVDSISDKHSQFDLTCKFQNEYINIEMQGKNQYNSYGKRAEYHVAHLLNHYVQKGMQWQNTPKVYQISILNFVYDSKNPSGFCHYQMQTDDGFHLNDRLNVIFVELTKIYEQIKCFNDDSPEKLTAVQRWVKFFLEANNPEKADYIQKLCDEERGIMQAEKVLSKIRQDEINWYRENLYWDNIANYNTMKTEARESGLEEGRQEGIKQGLEEGRKQGLEQGLEQGQFKAKKEMAVKLLSMGKISIEEISDLTNLSIEELNLLEANKA